MSENNNENTFPFQLKLYQNKLPEIIVDEPITMNHRIFPAIQTLMMKFPIVFLELKSPGYLTKETQSFFENLENPDKIIIVAESHRQVEPYLTSVAVLPTVQSALLRLKHKKGIETAAKQFANLQLMRDPCFSYLEQFNQPNLDFSDVVKKLNENPQISAEVLDGVNHMDKVSTPFNDLNRAVSFVGVDGIRQIFIEKAFTILGKIFSNQPSKLCHMRRCSTLAGMLGERFSDNPHIYWKMRSAALMHDIGSLLISFYASAEANRCYTVSQAKKVPIYEIENIILGYNHMEAGLLMAKIMHLPEYLLPTIANHHKSPFDKNDILLLSTVIANGYLNLESEHIGHTEYDECINMLEEAKHNAEKEKQDKEFARKSAKLSPKDEAGRQKLYESIYGTNENNGNEEDTGEFCSKKLCFDPITIELEFKEKIAHIMKDGYAKPLY